MSIAALQAEIDRRTATLMQRRDQLVAELEQLDEELAAIGGTAAPAAPRKRGRPPKSRTTSRATVKRGRRRGRPPGSTNKTNLVESLHKLLKNRTMNVTDMSEAVQRAGYKTKSPNFRTIVNQTLISNPKRFKRIARGEYTAK